MSLKTFTLNNGQTIPSLGFGTWELDKEEICVPAVTQALKTGYRVIDTAARYMNEAFVGKALAESGLKREHYHLTTKVWVTDFGYEQTLRAFDKSLKKLGLEYVDLYLLHWPVEGFRESWKALEKLQDEGLTKAIGVCNFEIDHLQALAASSNNKPVLNQVETHPLFQQRALLKYMNEQDILLEAWSPLGRGDATLLTNPVLQEIARSHSKDVGQVILRWHLQRGSLAIPRSSKPSRVESNFQIYDFELSDDQMAAINALDTNQRSAGDPKDPEWIAKLMSMPIPD